MRMSEGTRVEMRPLYIIVLTVCFTRGIGLSVRAPIAPTKQHNSSDHHPSSTRMVPSFLDYLAEREVTIKDRKGSLLPLQIYSASCLKRIPRRERQSISDMDLASLSVSSKHLLTQELNRYDHRRLTRKMQAEARAAKPLDASENLHILHADEHICVVHKPSGILSVPGPRRNPSVLNLVYDTLQPPDMDIDQMVVHRLDMDTSGVVLFGLTPTASRILHEDFRNRHVRKSYQALVCGHVQACEGEIDLPLERDPTHAPFMRVALPVRTVPEPETAMKIHDSLFSAPKPSLTAFEVLSREYLNGHPVTRVQLTPHTGRTHQLRVHCASIGHPIVRDDLYGFDGDACPDGGLEDVQIQNFSNRASLTVQQSLLREGRQHLCLHAQELNIHHPFTGAPIIFRAQPNF